MSDLGYANYQDPRLRPPEEPEGPTCGSCAYYREVTRLQRANRITHCIGICVYEVFQADTFEELAAADLMEADPTDEPCRDYREEDE